MLGVHRFYVGKSGTGLLSLLTGGALGIWTLIDIILIISNKFSDVNRRRVSIGTLSSFNKILLVIGSIGSFALMIVGSVLALILYLTGELVSIANLQLAAIKSGEFEQAYSYNAPALQKAISLDQFKKLMQNYPTLQHTESSYFNKRGLDTDSGFLAGSVTATDGTITKIEYGFIKDKGVWKINSMQVTPDAPTTK